MRGELRTHGVDLSDDKLYILVDTANKYIAEGDMDLDAWDPRIMADVKTLLAGPFQGAGHRRHALHCGVHRASARPQCGAAASAG
jgi:hypothetical protein